MVATAQALLTELGALYAYTESDEISVLLDPEFDLFGRGGALKSSWYGDCLPERDFPMLTGLYLQGRLPLEKFVSETITLDGIEESFAKMQRGDVLRSVVKL